MALRLSRRFADMTAPLQALVLAQLSKGGFQSGADLARQLGVSRTAVWKAVSSLRELGLAVQAVRNRGYQLPAPCEPLDAAAIRGALDESARERVRRIEAVWSIPSTNAALLERQEVPPGSCEVLLAEHQTAGRGRRGRSWLAPPGSALCLSIGWSFEELPRDLAALGLAVGVSARGVLAKRARERIAIKWPNDLTVAGRKLAGILIEMRAESDGPAYAVVGIGVNLALGAGLSAELEAMGARATDLKAAGADPAPRNAIAAELIEALVSGLELFGREGLGPFIEAWQDADALCGREVSVLSGDSSALARGVARGIDLSGALLVATEAGVRRFFSGEVSVRTGDGEESAPSGGTGASAAREPSDAASTSSAGPDNTGGSPA